MQLILQVLGGTVKPKRNSIEAARLTAGQLIQELQIKPTHKPSLDLGVPKRRGPKAQERIVGTSLPTLIDP